VPAPARPYSRNRAATAPRCQRPPSGDRCETAADTPVVRSDTPRALPPKRARPSSMRTVYRWCCSLLRERHAVPFVADHQLEARGGSHGLEVLKYVAGKREALRAQVAAIPERHQRLVV